MSHVVIAGAKRTAIGSFQGQFTGVPATKLGSVAIQAALEQSGVNPDDVSEVIMGCVLPAGLGQAPTRQAALGAGIPPKAGCTTINKDCGSGMKAVMLAHDAIKVGSADIVVAGGMESMTNAPHLIPNSRAGIRYGEGKLIDHMAWDGLTNPYDTQAMGLFGEQCVSKYAFSREDQDAFATASVERAVAATKNGAFKAEIAPVTVSTRKGETVISRDEQPFTANIEKIPTLRPAFAKDGTVTPANSSSISDGAAALVLMRRSEAERRGLTPLATIIAHSTHSQEPQWFTTAPVGALKKLFDKTGWKPEDVGLYEINEAFAVVTMAAMREFNLPADKVNVHGGACALGHPVGASGARIVAALINAMRKYDVKKGVASLCIGGGEATAMAIELAA